MKKRILTTLLSLSVFTLLNASAQEKIFSEVDKKSTQTLEKELNVTQQKLSNKRLMAELMEMPIFKRSGIEINYIQAQDFGGFKLYQTRTNRGDFYIIESRNQKKLIIPGINIIQKLNKSYTDVAPVYLKQDLTDIVSDSLLKIGTGKKHLILVTNPECHACQDIHREFEKKPEILKNYTFHIIPIHFSSKDGISQAGAKKTEKILLAKTNEEKVSLYNNFMQDLKKPAGELNREDVSIKSLEDKIKVYEGYAQRIGATGSPMFFDLDARPVNVMEVLSVAQNH